MSAVVGGITVIDISAPIQMAGYKTIEATRPGVDGYDVRLLGFRGDEGSFVLTLDCGSAALLSAAKLNFKSMESEVITITDNLGNIWLNILVKKMTSVMEHRALAVTGGINGGPYILQMQCDYLVVATYY